MKIEKNATLLAPCANRDFFTKSIERKRIRSDLLVKQPENNLVRLPTLLICGMGLILSGSLIWWNMPHHNSSSTKKIHDLETRQTARQYTKLSQHIESISTYTNSVRPQSVAPVINDSADDLLKRLQTFFATGDPADRDFAYTNLVPALVKMKPKFAAQFAESINSDLLRADILRVVAQTWASLNPTDAANWAAQLPDAGERNLELSYVCVEIAATAPARAVQIVIQSGLGEHTEAVLQDIAQQWAEQDLSSAATWIEQLPAGEERNQMIKRLAYVKSKTDPADAARMVVSEIPAGWIQIEAAISVVHQWGQRDMAGARAWVDAFPDGPIRDRAENELAGIAAYRNAQPEKQN